MIAQIRRIQASNIVTSSGVQDARLVHVLQENQRLAQTLYLNENQAILNRELMMLEQQAHQERNE